MSLLKNHEVRYVKTRYDHGSHNTDVFDFLTQETRLEHGRGAETFNDIKINQ